MRFIALALLLASTTAAADDAPHVIGESSYHLSGFYMVGGYSFPGRTSSFRAMGLRLHERDGIVAGGVVTALLAIPALASNSPNKHLGTTYHYTYDATYRVDWYRRKTEEERRADFEATSGLLGFLYYSRHQFDLEVFVPQKDVSNARGFGLNFMWVSWGRRVVFEIGGPKLRYLHDRDGAERYTLIEYGAPLRLWAPIGNHLIVRLQTVLGVTYTSRAVPIGADPEDSTGIIPVSLELIAGIERAYISAGAFTHAAGEGQGKIGATADVGVRF